MPVVVYKKLGKFFNHNRVEIYFVPALRLIKLYDPYISSYTFLAMIYSVLILRRSKGNLY